MTNKIKLEVNTWNIIYNILSEEIIIHSIREFVQFFPREVSKKGRSTVVVYIGLIN